MNAPFFALWVPAYYRGSEAVRRTLDLRDAMQALFDAHPELIELATSAADIERITKTGKIAAILSLEGGHQIDDDLAVLRMYQRLGIRAMTLTHFKNNNWADSSTDKPAHNGLTPFGKQVVREMNRIGVIVDVSHVADKTFYDAVAVSSKPVIATHSSCRALTNVPRDMTDDMLRALAKNGGVVSINIYPGFINNKDAEAGARLITQISSHEPTETGAALDAIARKAHFEESTMKPASATIDDVVAHIDHAVKIAGIDHVGIGSDFDGIDSVPKGLEDISKDAPAGGNSLKAERLFRLGRSKDLGRQCAAGDSQPSSAAKSSASLLFARGSRRLGMSWQGRAPGWPAWERSSSPASLNSCRTDR